MREASNEAAAGRMKTACQRKRPATFDSTGRSGGSLRTGSRPGFEINHLDEFGHDQAQDHGKGKHTEENFGVAALLPLLSARKNYPAKECKTSFNKQVHSRANYKIEALSLATPAI
jgi:hypothetical protein